MARSFYRLLARALAASAAGVFLVLGGLTATAYASGDGSGGGSNAGPPSDAAQAQSMSASGGTSSTGFNGNKGHVQIEGAPDCGATPCGNDNDPHVGCTLTVQFFGYPSGTNSAGVVIAGQAPSGTGKILTDSFTFAGKSSPNGSLLDTSKTYSITVTQLGAAGLKSQPKQGYHLRIDVSVNGEPAKSKVVWYGCPTPAAVAGLSRQVTTTTTPTTVDHDLSLALGSSKDSAKPDSSGISMDSAALPDTPAGKPSLLTDTPVATRSAAKAAGDSHGFLAFTGWDVLLGLALAAAAVGTGLWLVAVSRRRQLA
jgi:hypothetical protein